jgi:hypothetical protein
MRGYNFWTHGVGTIVEFPARASRILHAGWGSLIEQPESRPGEENNWFHLPLHKPSWIPVTHWIEESATLARSTHTSVSRATLAGVTLKASLNENANIRELHVRAGGTLIHSQSVDLRGPTIDHEIDLRDPVRRTLPAVGDEGLALCVRVVFLSGTPTGQVIFRGAGAYYIPGRGVTPPEWGVDWPGP